MNILWATIIITHLGARPHVVEVWQTKDACEKYAKEIRRGSCFEVSVSNKYDIQKQIETINELIK